MQTGKKSCSCSSNIPKKNLILCVRIFGLIPVHSLTSWRRILRIHMSRFVWAFVEICPFSGRVKFVHVSLNWDSYGNHAAKVIPTNKWKLWKCDFYSLWFLLSFLDNSDYSLSINLAPWNFLKLHAYMVRYSLLNSWFKFAGSLLKTKEDAHKSQIHRLVVGT